MDLSVAGLASGFDWKSLVDQLVDVERIPQQRLRQDQTKVEQRKNAYGSIKTQLSVLQNRLNALKEASLFESRTASVSDSSFATVSVASGATAGTFAFDIQQLATVARRVGTADIGQALSSSSDVSGVVLGSAGLAQGVTAGVFTVNGAQVTIATSDTLQGVFDKISTATSGVVTGSYDPATDKVTLTSSSGNVVLGAANDTSNALAALGLRNNGSTTVESGSSLGRVKGTAVLSDAGFTGGVSDGGSGAGSFKINGVEVTYNASTDTLNGVIDKINKSSAGVSARYDRQADQLILTNKQTGDVGIALEEISGNFLSASGLTGGSFESGKDLLYTIENGAQLSSHSNTISEASSGWAGLTVTALKEGQFQITVGSDKGKVKTAITDFITEYNKAQSLIENQTASSTDAKGKVTAGLLSSESFASAIAATLRSESFKVVGGLPEEMNHLADIGITTDGNTNELKLENEELLDTALANNLAGLQTLFADETSGIAVKMQTYMEGLIGEEGTFLEKEGKLTKEIAEIDVQIADLERQVQSRREQLLAGFQAMEAAQAKINQQMQFLSQRFGNSSLLPK